MSGNFYGVTEVPGQHVRWIEKKSGYSIHGTFIRKTIFGKCVIEEKSWRKKIFKLKSKKLEWFYDFKEEKAVIINI